MVPKATIASDVFERLQKDLLAGGDDIMRDAPKCLSLATSTFSINKAAERSPKGLGGFEPTDK